jgi:hypothetical protein
MNILTRRQILAGASALLCAPAIRSSRAATFWYVEPPPLLRATRTDGVQVLSIAMQRDRIIGSRTRAATPAGTVFDFARVADGSGVAYAKFDDATYRALIAANPTIFADCTITNSISAETADATLIDEENWDTHPQLCVMMGDSLMDSTAGFTVHPELALPQNQCWAQPVASKPVPYTTTPDFSGFWNRSAYTSDATLSRARICWKFANRGWRLATLPGIAYPGPLRAWADQKAYLQCIPVAPDQQLAFIIQAGTNDQHETLRSPVLLYGRPEFGRPNMIEDCLAPLVAMIRGLYPAAQFPDIKIGVMTPIARWWTANATAANGQLMNEWGNAQFSAYANWLTIRGNPQSIGIDAVWDSRRDPALDCRKAATVTLDSAVYQADRTHLMANGYVHHLGPGATALLDRFWA